MHAPTGDGMRKPVSHGRRSVSLLGGACGGVGGIADSHYFRTPLPCDLGAAGASSFSGDPPAGPEDASPGSTHAPPLSASRVSRGVGLDSAHGLAIVDTLAALRALMKLEVGHSVGAIMELCGPIPSNPLDPAAPAGWATLDFQHTPASDPVTATQRGGHGTRR